MTTRNDSEAAADDAVYESYLREVMNNCLPAALVEVVQQRPADPIHYLTQYLYRYRRQRPLRPPTDPVLHSWYNRTLQKSRLANKTVIAPNHDHNSQIKRVHFVDITEDSDEGLEDVKIVINSDIKVHLSVCKIFSDIGDIFDDEDVT